MLINYARPMLTYDSTSATSSTATSSRKTFWSSTKSSTSRLPTSAWQRSSARNPSPPHYAVHLHTWLQKSWSSQIVDATLVPLTFGVLESSSTSASAVSLPSLMSSTRQRTRTLSANKSKWVASTTPRPTGTQSATQLSTSSTACLPSTSRSGSQSKNASSTHGLHRVSSA